MKESVSPSLWPTHSPDLANWDFLWCEHLKVVECTVNSWTQFKKYREAMRRLLRTLTKLLRRMSTETPKIFLALYQDKKSTFGASNQLERSYANLYKSFTNIRLRWKIRGHIIACYIVLLFSTPFIYVVSLMYLGKLIICFEVEACCKAKVDTTFWKIHGTFTDGEIEKFYSLR